MIVTTNTRSWRIVTVDLDKPRGVTRTQIKGLCADKAAQLRGVVRRATSTTPGSAEAGR